MYVGDIQSKLKNRLKQHLYINIVIKQHTSNSSGMQRYYKIIIYPRCYVILMKLYSQYISSIIPLWFKKYPVLQFCRTCPTSVLVQGAPTHRLAQVTASALSTAHSRLPSMHFLFSITILPFYYAPNLADGAGIISLPPEFAGGAHDTCRMG